MNLYGAMKQKKDVKLIKQFSLNGNNYMKIIL